MKFYNTLSRKKEIFKPIDLGKVRLYTCGPTVYNYAHVGNLRAFIFEDLLRRSLEFAGFEVLHVMNITDIDDKTIHCSQQQKRSLSDFTNEYTDAFFNDLKILNIVPAHYYPRATEFVDGMINMIEILESKGFTYVADDGSVFYKISKFNEYGKLARLDPDKLKSGQRVEEDEYGKEEGRDFALWKGYKSSDGDVFWDSPWGRGRPGWHIECSVMSTHYLGSHFDIHCGGVDNIFPHHENEIAQSCAATGDPFVNYWLHNEHLLVEGEKMSKSAGNFYTLPDLIKKGFKPEAIRYTLLSTHYRSKLNFTSDKVVESQKCINRLRELNRRLENISISSKGKNIQSGGSEMLENFSEKLLDDLNISGALGELFVWVNSIFGKIDRNELSYDSSRDAINYLNKVDMVLGVLKDQDANVSSDIQELIDLRNKARAEKKWEEADKIREQLDRLGIVLDDTSEGTVWRKK